MVYFANSINGLAIAEAITARIFQDHQYSLDWLDYEKYDDPKRVTRLSVETAFLHGGVKSGMEKMEEVREEFPDSVGEDSLTEVARILGSKGRRQEAIEV
jgi:hypothetical protein